MFEDLGRTITESERSIIYEKGFRTISFLRNSNDLNIVDSSGHIDMEVRIESMICVWDDAIPTMFLEFVNLLTLTTSEGELRKSVKEFAEKHELDKFFLYGFGSHHFYLHQRYTSNPEMVMKNRVLSVHF